MAGDAGDSVGYPHYYSDQASEVIQGYFVPDSGWPTTLSLSQLQNGGSFTAISPGRLYFHSTMSPSYSDKRGGYVFTVTLDATVPNVVGMTKSEATSAITAAGLVVGTTTYTYSNTAPFGQVFAQSPVAGTSVALGSVVNLTVSTAVTVPNVVGMTKSEATSAITAAGLVVGTTSYEYSDAEPPGQVIAQNPVAGTSIDMSLAVDLIISSAPCDLVDGGEATRSFAPRAIAAGQLLEVKTQVRNRGDATSGSFRVDFYASLDRTITSNDYSLGTYNLSSIPKGGASMFTWSGAFPASVPGGTYYVGWIIDAGNQVTETNENNNTAYKEAYQITVQGGGPGPGVDGADLAVAPASGGSFSGPIGGPFVPQHKTYTLTNTGNALLSWRATATQSWVTFSRSSGILAAGAKTYVNVSVHAGAIGEGTYMATLTFTNQTNGKGTTGRSLTLAIGGGASTTGAIIHVDDDAPADPGPGNSDISDPAENGSPEHPFDRVQEGIDSATDGDTVLVLPGLYLGGIDLGGKAIVVTSLLGIDPNAPEALGSIDCTMIDALGGGPVATFANGEGPDCVLKGLTLIGGEARSGGGILCESSSPTISHCVIAGNRATRYGGGGGGVDCYRSSATFVNCTIADNYAGEPGGGVTCEQSDITFASCIIWGNAPDALSVTSGEAPSVRYCDVEGGWLGTDNIDVNPGFTWPGHWALISNLHVPVDPATPGAVWMHGDYHLQSRSGRFDPVAKNWTTDPTDSPCIDAGDPTSVWSTEPAPNGGRINIGAYGGTAEAGKSGEASTRVLTFDDITSAETAWIPGDYGGFLMWDTFVAGKARLWGGSGYHNGLVSGDYVAYNGNGNPAEISGPSFNIIGAYFTAAWNDGLNIDIEGYRDGAQVYTYTAVVDTSGPSWVQLDFANVDRVRFTSYGGTHNPQFSLRGTQFAMDDMSYWVNAPDHGFASNVLPPHASAERFTIDQERSVAPWLAGTNQGGLSTSIPEASE
ncbi:MAG: PASTA domain-containing protein [Sedimentisphaerales bacterium]|nr:PASTA domain-containing protein [Sedimentisphaerales bacterium]